MSEMPENRPSPLALLAAYSYCAVLGTYLCQLISEPAFYFHLTVGNWIRSHGTLPVVDSWFKANAGNERLATSWLFDLSVSLLEELGGSQGLAIGKLILCVLLVLALYHLFHRASRDNFLSLLVTTIVTCGLLESAPYSPDLIAWSFLAYSLECGLRRAPVLLFVLLGAAFANFHTEFYLGALLLFGCLFPVERRSVCAFGVSGLLSPYFTHHLIYAFTGLVAKTSFAVRTGEFAVNVFDYRFCFLLFLWVFLVLLCSGQMLEPRKRRLLIAAGLNSLLALVFSPLLAFALISTGFALSAIWPDCHDERPIVHAIDEFAARLRRVPLPGVIWVFFCLITVNSVNFYRFPIVEYFLPVKEIDQLMEENLPSPIWHESMIGPYVAYRFSGRLGDAMRLAFDDFEVVRTAPELLEGERNSQGDFLKTFSDANTFLVRRGSSIYELLSSSPQFKRVSFDASAVARKELNSWVLFVREVESKSKL